MKSPNSVLRMEKLVFDSISFERIDFKSDKPCTYSMEAKFAQNTETEVFRSTLTFKVDKEGEYRLTIVLTGFFSFDKSEEIKEKEKMELLQKNTIAIMMPYMRSQVSLMTAQPGVECVVLPPFNINNMFESKQESDEDV